MSSIPESGPGRHLRPSLIACAAAVFVLTLFAFAFRLSREGHFIDESAYIAQSYYFDLFLRGARDDVEWLNMPAVDVPPLTKYLIGASLWAGGHPRPGPSDAWAWYRDQSYRPE